MAVLVVHKYYTDPFYLNSFISLIGGIKLAEVNDLEEEFLETIDFCLSVKRDEYDFFVGGLKSHFVQPLRGETIKIIEEIKQAQAAQ